MAAMPAIPSGALAAGEGTIEVVVDGLRNSTGKIRISLFSSKEGFPGKQEKAIAVQDLAIEEGRAKGSFAGVPYGVYAVAAIHDENRNGKLDFKWKIIPGEGYGASKNPESTIGPPAFRKASFTLKEEEIRLAITMQYW